MESAFSNVNVRAMKGRFETSRQTPPTKTPLKTPTWTHEDKKPTPSLKIEAREALPKHESMSRHIEKDESEIDESRSQRNRSMSTGKFDIPLSSQIEPDPSKINRNKSFNYQIGRPNKSPYKDCEEMSSTFTEKQKLVENIVKNIKNGAQYYPDNPKTNKKQVTTTKFEKDLKNALKKGVRNWHNNQQKNPKKYPDCPPSPDFYKNNNFINVTHQFSEEEFGDFNIDQFDHKTLGVDKPIRPPRRKNIRNKPKAPSPPRERIPNPQIQSATRESPVLDNQNSPNFPINDRFDVEPNGGKFSDNFQTNEEIYYSTPCIDPPPFQSQPEGNYCSGFDTPDHPQDIPLLQSAVPGSPPEKPPRTFAHDIYKSMKESQIEGETVPSVPDKLKDIDALYAKPLKKEAREAASRPPLLQTKKPINHVVQQQLPSKPSVAPKPTDIVERSSKKRYSVADPSSPQWEDSARDLPKRNSSFRQSLRKFKKFPSPKQDQELQIKKRWRQLRRNLNQPVKERSTKFREDPIHQQHSKSEEILCSRDRQSSYIDDPIYAAVLDLDTKRTASQELHYMCSPLFDIKESEQLQLQQQSGLTKSRLPQLQAHHFSSSKESLRNKEGFVNGFKNEFRQSCRVIKKKFNRN